MISGAAAPFALAVERVEGRVELPVSGSAPPVAGPVVRVAAGLALLDVARLLAALPGAR